MRNLELKARLADLDAARTVARAVATERLSPQHQIDTYFHCHHGRLKLRQIDGLSAQLVSYARADEPGPKVSDYVLVPVSNPESLKAALTEIRHQKRRLDGARDTLIHANLRFVPYVVRQLGLFGAHFMDLIQEGNVGLMMAVDRFEPERGHRFATYAFWWIRQAITRALTDSFHLVKFSAYTRERVRRIQKVSRELEKRLGRRPTPEEIASEMNLPVRKVRDLMVASQAPKPLENTNDHRPEAGVLGVVADKRVPDPLEDTLKRERHEQVLSALDRLSPREKQVIRLRYGIGFDTGYTLREIGEMLRISRERVRQIETDAIIKIQEWHDIPSRLHRRPLTRRNGSQN